MTAILCYLVADKFRIEELVLGIHSLMFDEADRPIFCVLFLYVTSGLGLCPFLPRR